MGWTSPDGPPHGQAAPAGKPTSGKNAAATIAALIEITTVAASGSSPPLIVAFQPAWQAAANSTAANTSGSMARRPRDLRVRQSCRLPPSRVQLIPECRPRPDLRGGALVLLGADDLGPEDMRRPPALMRIVEHRARERHHVGPALGDDRFGLLRRGDQAARPPHHPPFPLSLPGDLHL